MTPGCGEGRWRSTGLPLPGVTWPSCPGLSQPLLPCCLEQAFSYEGSKTSSIPQGGDRGSEQSRDLPWVTKTQSETQSHRVRHGAQGQEPRI